MRSTRTLKHTYWADEGEAAVRWLIGRIETGPVADTRDDLRRLPLAEVKRWAERTRHTHLAELTSLAIDGEPTASVLMNPKLGPTGRLAAVAASALLKEVAASAQVVGGEVSDDTADFSITLGPTVARVSISPVFSTITIPELRMQEVWETRTGAKGAARVILDVIERANERVAAG